MTRGKEQEQPSLVEERRKEKRNHRPLDCGLNASNDTSFRTGAGKVKLESITSLLVPATCLIHRPFWTVRGRVCIGYVSGPRRLFLAARSLQKFPSVEVGTNKVAGSRLSSRPVCERDCV